MNEKNQLAIEIKEKIEIIKGMIETKKKTLDALQQYLSELEKKDSE